MKETGNFALLRTDKLYVHMPTRLIIRTRRYMAQRQSTHTAIALPSLNAYEPIFIAGVYHHPARVVRYASQRIGSSFDELGRSLSMGYSEQRPTR